MRTQSQRPEAPPNDEGGVLVGGMSDTGALTRVDEAVPLRVLVVDEEAHSRDALTELLCDEGYDAVGADSSVAALDWIERVEPQVVIMDLASALLPRGSMLDALPERLPWVRFVVMTPFLDADLRAAIEERGVTACALPIDLPDLLFLLERWDTERRHGRWREMPEG